MYRFDIGPLKTIVLTSPALMKEAFQHESLQGRPYNMMPSFEIMMKGRGLDGNLLGFAGSQGQNWSEQRRFFVSCLRQNITGKESVKRVINEEGKLMVNKIEDGSEVSMHQFFMEPTVNVIWRPVNTKKFLVIRFKRKIKTFG